MSFIDETWLRIAFQSLHKTLDFDAGTRKQAIQFLLDEGFWDETKLTWEAAIARWNSCLNPNKPEFFKLGEVWALMRRFGQHELFLAMAQDLGYEVRPMATEERRQVLLDQLQRTVAAQQETMAQLQASLERLDATAPAPRGPAFAGGTRPAFSLADSTAATAVGRMGCP